MLITTTGTDDDDADEIVADAFDTLAIAVAGTAALLVDTDVTTGGACMSVLAKFACGGVGGGSGSGGCGGDDGFGGDGESDGGLGGDSGSG